MATLAKNTIWGGFSGAIQIASGVLLAILSIRLLGSNQFGYLSMILSCSILYLSIVRGFFTIQVRHLLINKNRNELFSSFVASGFIYSLLMCIFLTLLVYLAKDLFISSILHNTNDPLLTKLLIKTVNLFNFSISIDIASFFLFSVLEGFERFDKAARCIALYQMVTLMLLATMVVLNSSITIDIVAYIYLISSSFRFLFTIFSGRSFFFRIEFTNFSKTNFRGAFKIMMKEAIIIQSASGLKMFVDPMNKFILNYFLGPFFVTQYELSIKAVTSIQNIFDYAFRSFMTLYSLNKEKIIQTYCKIIPHVILLAFYLYVISGLILSLLISYEFIDVSFDTIILYLIVLPMGMSIVIISPIYHVLISSGDIRYVLYLNLFLAVSNLFITSVCVPTFGFFGAGFGIMFATIINALSVLRRFEKRIHSVAELYDVLKRNIHIFFVGSIAMIILPVIAYKISIYSFSMGIIFASILILMGTIGVFSKIYLFWSNRNEYIG